VSDPLHAEWTKLRTTGSTWWLMLGAVVVTVAASAAIAAFTHRSNQTRAGWCRPRARSNRDPRDPRSHRGIRHRHDPGNTRRDPAAESDAQCQSKAINLAGITLIAALPAVAGCLIAGRLLLPAAGLSPAHGYALVSVAHGLTLRAAFGSVAYLELVAVLSLSAGTILRDTAVSTGIVLGLLYLPPLLAHLISGPWQRHIEQISPMSAGLAIQTTRNIRSLPISPWGGLGVLAVWAAVMFLASLAVINVRDT
jgi:ABC-2 type transport system permease protein